MLPISLGQTIAVEWMRRPDAKCRRQVDRVDQRSMDRSRKRHGHQEKRLRGYRSKAHDGMSPATCAHTGCYAGGSGVYISTFRLNVVSSRLRPSAYEANDPMARSRAACRAACRRPRRGRNSTCRVVPRKDVPAVTVIGATQGDPRFQRVEAVTAPEGLDRRRIAAMEATAMTSAPTRPGRSRTFIVATIHANGHATPSIAAQVHRPGQYGTSGRRVRPSSNHTVYLRQARPRW